MSSKKNYVDVRKFLRDVDRITHQVPKAAERAVQRVRTGTTSESAFTMAFDEVEAIPFGVGSQATIVVTASTDDPVELEEKIDLAGQQALLELEQQAAQEVMRLLR